MRIVPLPHRKYPRNSGDENRGLQAEGEGNWNNVLKVSFEIPPNFQSGMV